MSGQLQQTLLKIVIFYHEIFKARFADHLCANSKFHAKEAANCDRMPITVDKLGEIERDQTENSCWLFWMSCVVAEFVYANTIILFNLGEYGLLEFSATIHLDFRE